MDITKFNIENPMPPPWMMYPNLSYASLGWRMGYGEEYQDLFLQWYNKMPEKEKYNEMFLPPNDFKNYYEEIKCFKPKTDEYYEKYSYRNENYHIDFWNEYGKPQYSINELQKDYRKGQKLHYLFFFGHTNDKDIVTKSCLSQWYIAYFSEDTEKFNSMEKYMMYNKALVFNDNDIAEKIYNSNSPKTIKELGRKVNGFKEDIWDKVKYQIVLGESYLKFSQNEKLRNFLIETKNKILVEASPYDKIWGIQMGQDEENIENPLKWKGENLLGFTLMEARSEIEKVYKNYYKINWTLINKLFDK